MIGAQQRLSFETLNSRKGEKGCHPNIQTLGKILKDLTLDLFYEWGEEHFISPTQWVEL